MAKRNLKPAKIILQGHAAHNGPICAAIGQLVISWANNESVFMAMLQVLIGDGKAALIAWHTLRTTQARLELIGNLSRDKLDEALASDVADAIKRFKGFTGPRNFYCHAQYDYDPSTSALMSARLSTISQVDTPIRHQRVALDKSALNALSETSTQLAEYNAVLWNLVDRVSAALGFQIQGRPGLQMAEAPTTSKPARQGKAPTPS